MTKATSNTTVHIVVTCASRKRYAIPDSLRLGHLRERRPGPRFAAWTRRLAAEPPSTPATDLYGGEHWQVARGLPALIGQSAKLWVCSAGYGLIAADTRLNPYAATFSARDPDSVGDTRAAVRDWWHRLTSWSGPDAHQPRSFTDLARRNPTASVVAVLSDAYLRACSDDLVAAADALRDRGSVCVIGPANHRADIDDVLVPVTARMRTVVGGSLQALHARVAVHLLTATGHNGTINCARLREVAREMMENASSDPKGQAPGIRLTDHDVRNFIQQELTTIGPASATTLLRRLRQSGRSCEQSRFKHLYAVTAAAEVNANAR